MHSMYVKKNWLELVALTQGLFQHKNGGHG